jgi:aspartate/methionine/tyrosine aminotransferase
LPTLSLALAGRVELTPHVRIVTEDAIFATMNIETFAMERLQCTWENVVDCDLSESGTRGITLAELVQWGFDLESQLRTPLSYSQTNGTIALRDAIAAHYPGASAANVMVTNGSAEANYLLMAALLEPGNTFAMEMPNYMQVKGLGAFWSQKMVNARPIQWLGDRLDFVRACGPSRNQGRVPHQSQ